jgi:hypothetical protein
MKLGVRPLSLLFFLALVMPGGAHAQQASMRWRVVEADNGALSAIAMSTLQSWTWSRESKMATVCFMYERGGCHPDNMDKVIFDCRGHYVMAYHGGSEMVAAPRSVIGAIARIACGHQDPAAAAPPARITPTERAQLMADAATRAQRCLDRLLTDGVGGTCDTEIHAWEETCNAVAALRGTENGPACDAWKMFPDRDRAERAAMQRAYTSTRRR